ncbi:MAG: HAMP domain-containing sensor histidine kinase [Pseudoflavonifractor sp.]|nr:HAMP domain-containing sensor histidine kinase [Pseudoflavonifractor sp.]
MKHDIRSSFLVKVLAILLAVVCGVGAFLGWAYCGVHWETLFDNGDYTCSAAYSQAMSEKYATLHRLLDYEHAISLSGGLNYLDQKEHDTLAASLDPSVTNFRYVVRDNSTGDILFSSNGKNSLDNVAEIQTAAVNWSSSIVTEYESDSGETFYYDADGNLVGTMPGDTTQARTGTGVLGKDLALEYGVDKDLPVRDSFAEARDSFSKGNMDYLYAAAGLTVGFAALSIFLACCAGHRRSADGFVLNWQDKIPYDLYLCLSLIGISACVALALSALEEVLFYYSGQPYSRALYAAAATALSAAFGLFTAGLMSFAARCKTKTLLRNTILWRLGAWIGRGCGRIGSWWRITFGSWDITKRAIFWFLLYLMGTVVTEFVFFLAPFYQGFVLFLLCRWVKEWKNIRVCTQAIVGGRPDTVIDTSGMRHFPDLAEHAGQLNDLGSAINSAVEERMKSERMKAELITNVSHDLKTPLTSIINYVDLLKKEDIESEKAREYIGVLDRKSQRLKKLTEDLVEASKASTGVLTVERERLGVTQLVSQAMGEYSEKLTAAGLTPVVSLPEQEVFVSADGRHFWRILDNLMGNCVKYAMPGTRVYLDVTVWDGHVILALKNISATQLNVLPEQLVERFVRGDESRTTEGSGLGLSIARSLTELQDGMFRVEVDGDLFKAIVSFPEVK